MMMAAFVEQTLISCMYANLVLLRLTPISTLTLSLPYTLHVSAPSVSASVPLLPIHLKPLCRFCPPSLSPFFSLSGWTPPPLFSPSAVWNAVLSIVLPCNCDTSSSVGLAARSPYLLRLHSVSPPQSAPEAQQTPPPTHPSHLTLTLTYPTPSSTAHPPHMHPSHPHWLNLCPPLVLGRHVCDIDMRTEIKQNIFQHTENQLSLR